MSVSIEDMQDMIQEWMAQATTPVDLAKVYAAIMQETNWQLEFVMKILMEDERA